MGNYNRRKKSLGSLGGGCALMVVVLVAWGFTFLIFPKLPEYEKTLEQGEEVQGEVLRIETVDNVRINGRHPRRVVFRYGDGQEGSMRMAMSESASKGQALKIRVLGENAYPEEIRPFARPPWLRLALIGVACFAGLIIALGIVRLLLVGGVLLAAGHSLLKKDSSPPPPPPLGPPSL